MYNIILIFADDYFSCRLLLWRIRRSAKSSASRHTDKNTEWRTDTQAHGRTRRCTDGHAGAQTQTQAYDGARTLNMHACSAWVGKSSRCRMRLDERTKTFEMYYYVVGMRRGYTLNFRYVKVIRLSTLFIS